MQLPNDKDRLLSTTKEICTVGSERNGRNGVRVPMQGSSLRLLFDPRSFHSYLIVEAVPQPDVTLFVARGKVLLRRMESQTCQSFGRDIFSESRLERGRRGDIGFVPCDSNQPCSTR